MVEELENSLPFDPYSRQEGGSLLFNKRPLLSLRKENPNHGCITVFASEVVKKDSVLLPPHLIYHGLHVVGRHLTIVADAFSFHSDQIFETLDGLLRLAMVSLVHLGLHDDGELVDNTKTL